MKKKTDLLFINSLSSLSVQVVAILSSFVVPKCILSAFGSAAYGTVESITGFLGFLTLLEAGVGSVSRAELYEPVAKQDYAAISTVVNETKRFFTRIANIYLVSVLALGLVYPAIADNGENFWFNFTLVLIVAAANLVQYYFGAGYVQVLYADRKVYLLNFIQTAAYLMNCVIVLLCGLLGTSIHVMKLLSSLAFIVKPLFVNVYVRRHYRLTLNTPRSSRVLTQKWNNLLQTLAYYVHSKTDVVVLTLLSTVNSVSVYSVYALITTGLSSIVSSLCNGFTAQLGASYGIGDRQGVQETFRKYDSFIFNLTVFLFTTASLLIVDFVKVYTLGVKDADYSQPVFSMLLILAEAVYCLRMPYNNMVLVAGHFKQTQYAALIEAAINIAVSVLLVRAFGLCGVAVGTLAAMLFRTVYLVVYLSKNILFLKLGLFFKKIAAVLFTAALAWGLKWLLPFQFRPITFFEWILEALAASILVLLSCVIMNLIFYKRSPAGTTGKEV